MTPKQYILYRLRRRNKMIVKSYRTCDICGKRLPHDVDKWSYHVESPSKIKVGIWKYVFKDPYDSFWSTSLICVKSVGKK